MKSIFTKEFKAEWKKRDMIHDLQVSVLTYLVFFFYGMIVGLCVMAGILVDVITALIR